MFSRQLDIEKRLVLTLVELPCALHLPDKTKNRREVRVDGTEHYVGARAEIIS